MSFFTIASDQDPQTGRVLAVRVEHEDIVLGRAVSAQEGTRWNVSLYFEPEDEEKGEGVIVRRFGLDQAIQALCQHATEVLIWQGD